MNRTLDRKRTLTVLAALLLGSPICACAAPSAAEAEKPVGAAGPDTASGPIAQNPVPTVQAAICQLQEPDPFLEPYQGNDTDGIEDIVKDIERCRERWRKDAEQRIEEHRKEDLYIKILKPDGSPFADQNIRIRLLKHKFHFGVVLRRVFFTEPDQLASWERERLGKEEWKYALDERFKLVRQFATQVGFANAFKYRLSAGRDHAYMIEQTLPRLRELGLGIRGHTLIWPGWSHMHEDALALKNDPEALRAFCEKQVAEYARLWDVDEWDVLNEPRTNHDIQDLLGEEVMVDWFRIAQSNVYNKGAGLYVNDYKVISKDDKAWNRDNIEKYRENVDFLLEHGAPLTHLGFQNRYSSLVEPEDIYRRLELFRDYGLPMKATEFEIRESKDTAFTEEERARFTADVMTVWFSHDMVSGIMAWTFFDIEGSADDKTGKKNAHSLLYNTGIKPNGKVWLYLIRNHWNTDELAETNDAGITTVRGFLGDYEVLMRDGEAIKRAELTLDKNENKYVLQL